MLIVMAVGATREQVAAVTAHIEALGLKGHPIPGAQRVAIGITGNAGVLEPAGQLGLADEPPLARPVFFQLFQRHFAAEGGRWDAQPVGVRHLRAIALSSVLMTAAHQPSDYVVCLVWSLIVSLVAVRTRSLGACVLMHAVSNLLLGLYIMATKQWGLW